MEHLIESVRKYPCLWNTTAIEYRDQELKDAAWAEVMKETDLSSVKEVKLKWKKLRDSYRDALKRQNELLAKEPGGAKRPYPWKYMGLMQFLQPHMSARKRPAGEGPRPEEPAAGNGHAARSEPVSDSDSDSDAPSEPKKRAAAGPSAPAGSGATSLARIERALEFLCRRAGAGAAAPPAAAPPHADPLDIFFNGMCQTTKRLPFHTQLKVKRTVFEAVTAAEEALLAEQQTYAALWAQAPSSGSSSPRSPPAPHAPPPPAHAP